MELRKWFGPAANPLRYERDMAADVASTGYAGYTQRIVLRSLDAPPGPPVGIWNLAQFPPGGEMLVPLYSRAVPQKCFGDIPADRVTIEDHLLRIRADFAGSHKIAVKAAALCGRTGYRYGQGDDWSLVVRNFFVNPSGEYIDVQRHDPDDCGYALPDVPGGRGRVRQFLRDGVSCSRPWGPCPKPARSEDVSQVWAFRGSREAIDHIAHKLLGAEPCSQDAT